MPKSSKPGSQDARNPIGLNYFATATQDLDRALAESLRQRYPFVIHLSRLEQSLRTTSAPTFREAAADAIAKAFGWIRSRKQNEIDRFVAALEKRWPDAATRYSRMQELCDHANSPLPLWAQSALANDSGEVGNPRAISESA